MNQLCKVFEGGMPSFYPILSLLKLDSVLAGKGVEREAKYACATAVHHARV
jgi:hypothetical protein